MINNLVLQSPEKSTFDILSPRLESGTVSIDNMYEHTRNGMDGIRERWIPNTGEYLILKNITVDLKNKSGAPIWGIPMDKIELGLDDRSALAAVAADESNIYNNKGTGFELVAYKDPISTPKVIRRFPLHATDAKDARYKLTEADTAKETDFYLNNALKPSKKIRIDTLGNLKIENVEGNKESFDLAIRPLLGSIRPGDDVLLKVVVNGVTLTTEAKDYLAVYDKKMLWRANLYIDELASDWNNVHPWNAPPSSTQAVNLPIFGDNPMWGKDTNGSWVWGYNEWNSPTTVAQGIVVYKGNQEISIASSTWHNRDNDIKQNRTVNNAVVYSVYCHDDIFEFNDKMNQQKDIIRYFLENNLHDYKKNKPDTSWTKTTAPFAKNDVNGGEGKWENYYIVDDLKTTVKIGNKIYYPYAPALASSANAGDDKPDNAKAYELNMSAGVDCVGFVQRSSSYSDSKYKMGIVKGYDWTTKDPEKGKTGFPRVDKGLSHLIYGHPQEGKANNLKPLSYVVPGDFIYSHRYKDGEEKSYHAMLVRGVNDDDGIDIELNSVTIIESNWPSVQMTKTCQDLNKNEFYKHFDISRFIMNE